MIVELQNAESRVTLCPEVGAAIARFTWRGCEILRRAPGAAVAEGLVRQMGMYPLVPYSNRIGGAELPVGGRSYRLRPNFPGEPHAIHGFGWQRAWQVVAATSDSAQLELRHAADDDWPFDCEARQEVRLNANVLQVSLAVKNCGAPVMPAGLGFHPFFPLDPGTRLQTNWTGMWAMGADSLPTMHGPVPPRADFGRPRPVAGWKVDHCFTGWSRRAVLDCPSHRVQLEASEPCRHIVVFAPDDGRNFIALEPVTNINNAFRLAADGVTDTGLKLLAAGESLAISMSLTLHKNRLSENADA